MPNQLPFLPGNVHADPTITRYHKTQLLSYQNGTVQGKFSFGFAWPIQILVVTDLTRFRF